jgi:Histidine kinase-, DNA gyrase B-, and HSP90-like ATPase
MATRKVDAPRRQGSELLPFYGAKFLENHAGRIVQDPDIAITELVANSWDAGASRVDITWPTQAGDTILVKDDGTGLTRQELEHRWMHINYNRLEEQGEEVEFPPGAKVSARKAWGQSGIGRHAGFYFADRYNVETTKGGKLTRAVVERKIGRQPYTVAVVGEEEARGHGTTISAESRGVPRSDDEIREVLGSRFFVDPGFAIVVNGVRVLLVQVDSAELFTVDIGVGTARVRRVDAEFGGRTARQNGVAWWVNGRLVGAPSWDLGSGQILDARRSAAKKYTYIVEADALRPFVKSDWSGLHSTRAVADAQRAIDDAVREDLNSVLGGERRERKRLALSDNRNAISILGPVSQEQIAQFLEEIQIRCPNMGDKELSDAVEVLARLEKSRSGYALLEKLAAIEPNDLDGLNHILSEWSIRDAKTVFNELRSRLALIQRLEQLVDNRKTDELHELQPLFERGLWIFGPEFEGPDFMANRTLATVLREFLGDGKSDTPRNRPDIVVLPEATLGTYSRDGYDERHEVNGYSHVVVVELKRGGFRLGRGEKNQAAEYCAELRKSGKVGRHTKITAYVLGSELADDATDPIIEGATTIHPRPYDAVLRSAHARTFNLLRRINLTVAVGDEDVRDIVTQNQTDFSDTHLPLAR